MTNAAREGARVGVLPGYADADVQTRVNDYLAGSGLTGPRVINVTSRSRKPPARARLPRGRCRSITPTTFVVLGPIGSAFGGNFGTIPLRAVSVMRTEAQAAP